jgi:hypothetical protein
MMRYRNIPGGTGVGVAVFLALITPGLAFAGPDLPQNEVQGEECPQFQKTDPADGSAVSAAPTLYWSSASGATRYDVCVDPTDDSVCDSGWTSAGMSLQFDPEGLAAGATYYWQVRALTWAGFVQADYGDWWSFTTVPAGPGSFGKTAPADPSFQPLTPLLAWSASSGADAYEYCYDSSDNGVCDSSWISTGTSTTAGLSGLGNNRTYFWQVRATNAEGTIEADGGAWWRFTSRWQRFADVPIDHPYWAEIEAFYLAGITTGCGVSPLIYCPEQNVTRAAMAVFILRAKYGSGYAPPPATHTFADLPVPGKEWQEAWVDQYYLEGITSGCGYSPLRYCPENPVTRAAMAVFLLRAKYGSSYAPPPATHTFADLPVAGKEWMEAWVDQAYSEGIVTACGTGPLIYCPESSVTRQEMAAFIVYAYDFPLP